MSIYIKPVLMLISSFLLLGAPQAYAAELSKGMNEYVKTSCPDLMKQQAGKFAAIGLKFSPDEVKDICACSGKEITKAKEAISSTAATTDEQLWAIVAESLTQCSRQSKINTRIKSCIADQAYRNRLKTKVGLDDQQYEQFCSCHTNLAYNESEVGLDSSDPQYLQVAKEKSAKKCLQPLMDANEAKKAKPAR